MNHKKRIVLFILSLSFIVTFCQSQNIEYRSKIRPVVRAKLDSLYPHANNIILNQSQISDTTQVIEFYCDCQETDGMIVLIFDTNANIRNKEVYYNSIKNLPDTIVSYMKKNASPPKVKFFNDYMIKYINKKGEISYGIEEQDIPNSWTVTEYLLKFKPSGELISKEVIPPAGW